MNAGSIKCSILLFFFYVIQEKNSVSVPEMNKKLSIHIAMEHYKRHTYFGLNNICQNEFLWYCGAF